MVYIGVLDYFLFLNCKNTKTLKMITFLFKWIPVVVFFIIMNNVVRIVLSVLLAIRILYSKNKKSKSKKDDTVKQNQIEKNQENIMSRGVKLIALLLVLISSIMFYLWMYYVLYAIGNLFGQTSTLNSQSVITYYNIGENHNEEVIRGVVVAQTGNTYYISSVNRELIVISSPYIRI